MKQNFALTGENLVTVKSWTFSSIQRREILPEFKSFACLSETRCKIFHFV